MNLLAGCRLTIAPKFHLNADWPSRVAVGAGVEESDGHFFARGPWRPPTPDELALLVATDGPAAPRPGVLPLLDESAPPSHARVPDDCVALFAIPEHLRGAWWELVDAAAASGGPVQGFDGFATGVSDFLTFKRLVPSGSVHMEALVTAPGERSIRVDPATGRPSGLGSTVAPWSAWPLTDAVARLAAVVNLGDESAGVVFVNLTLPGLAAELARCVPNEPLSATVDELVGRFMRARPDYPLVRLRLGPGEACLLPAGGLILDGDMTGQADPGVMLLISEGPIE